MWARRQEVLSCIKCSASLPQVHNNEDGRWVQDVGGPWMQTVRPVIDIIGNMYGTQPHTCYGCLKNYCLNCRSDGDDSSQLLDACTECARVYCAGCSPVIGCYHPMCWTKLCSGCIVDERACSDCGGVFCDQCFTACDSCGAFCHYCASTVVLCNNCFELMCSDCRSQSRGKETTKCEHCLETSCNECRLEIALSNYNQAEECCSNLTAPLLMEHIKELTTKNEELTCKNKELTNDNEQLRSKIKSLRKFEGNPDQEGHAGH